MTPSQPFQIIVISLPAERARREPLCAALGKLSLDYRVLDAVNGVGLERKQLADAQSRWRWLIKGYSFTAGQVGCWMSHRTAWSTFLGGTAEFCVVLEDDAALTPGFRDCIEALLERDPSHDLVQLEYRNRSGATYGVIERLRCGASLIAVSGKTNGGAGYLITRRGAEKLLSIHRMAFCNDDWAWYQALTGLTRAAVEPCVVQLSQAPSSIDKINGLSGTATRRKNRRLPWPAIHRFTLQPLLYQLLRAVIFLRRAAISQS